MNNAYFLFTICCLSLVARVNCGSVEHKRDGNLHSSEGNSAAERDSIARGAGFDDLGANLQQANKMNGRSVLSNGHTRSVRAAGFSGQDLNENRHPRFATDARASNAAEQRLGSKAVLKGMSDRIAGQRVRRSAGQVSEDAVMNGHAAQFLEKLSKGIGNRIHARATPLGQGLQ